MSRTARIAIGVGALAILVAAFVLLRSGDEKTTPPATTTATVVATTTTPAGTATVTKTVIARPRPDGGPLLTAAKVTKFSVPSGSMVRFRVRSAQPEEVHIHGYDIKRDVPGGQTVPISFKATIAGGFVIEFESSGTQIGALTVEP